MNLIELKCKHCGGTLKVNPELDEIVCIYCGTKILIDDEATKIKRVENAKLKARKENHEQDLKEKTDNLEQKIKECEILDNSKYGFKKSFISKAIIILFAFAIMILFVTKGSLTRLLLIIQSIILIVSYLIGMQIIKEPFKGLRKILTIIAFVMIVPIVSTNGMDLYQKSEKIIWDDIILNEYLPDPGLTKGEMNTNSSENIDVSFYKASVKDYNNYIDKCKKIGFTIDSNETNSWYEAYNSEGYKIYVYYTEYDNELNIELNTPTEFENFEWPSTGVASLIPKPNSNLGNVSYEYEDNYYVLVSNISYEEYGNYVKLCQDAGFVKDYSKHDKSYEGLNENNVKLCIDYLGFNMMSIHIYTKD